MNPSFVSLLLLIVDIPIVWYKVHAKVPEFCYIFFFFPAELLCRIIVKALMLHKD